MRSKILYSLLAVFAATCLFSSVAKERLHKLVIDSEEDFYEYPDRWKAHINSSLYSGQPVVNDIDSITFDVGKQQMSIFSSTPKSNSLITATYNLTKLKGFSFSYLDDGKMPTTMVGYASDSDNVNSVFLTWRPVEGASGYEIAFAKEPYYTKMDRFDWITDPSTLHITVSADSTEHKFDNLFFGASYRAAVKVLSPDGKAYDSEWSIRPNFKSYLVNVVEDDILRFTISDNPIWTDTKGVLSV
ncbi:MAG: hypothetical protein K2K72_04255, partial [Duncaniella sp.]|nr:hypothetical protein [Duncaniella sp.]